MGRSSLVTAVMLCLTAGMASAAGTTVPREGTDAISVPQLINYQGKLTDAGGNLLTGDYDMYFEIFDAPSGGTSYWNETRPDVPVDKGLFNVMLGSVNPVAVLPDGPDCWLEITIEGEVITDRVRLVSVPYAAMAQDADDAANLGGVAAASYATQAWVVANDAGRSGVAGDLYEGTSTLSSKYAPIVHVHPGYEQTTNKDVANGYCGLDANAKVALPKLAQGGASAGQILGWSGSQWAPTAAGGTGTVTSVGQSTGVVCTPDPITTTGTVAFDQAWGDGQYINSGEAAGGDLTATYPNPTVRRLQGRAVATTAPTDGQILRYTTSGGGSWLPSNDWVGLADYWYFDYDWTSHGATTMRTMTWTFTGMGLAVGDLVLLAHPTWETSGLGVFLLPSAACQVVGTDQLRTKVYNVSSSAQDPPLSRWCLLWMSSTDSPKRGGGRLEVTGVKIEDVSLAPAENQEGR